MNARKPRADSLLKTLPADRQDAIADYAADHTLEQVVKWLHEDGLKSNRSSLSDFLSWHSLQRQFREDEQTTEALLQQLKKEMPDLSDAQLDQLGQRTFSLLAIRRKDLDGFLAMRSAMTKAELEKAKLKLREKAEERQSRRLKLDLDKFQFDAAKAALQQASKLKQISRDTKLSEPEKVNATRQLLFGVLPK